jgi:PEGA domain
MKKTPRVLIASLLGACFATQMACATTPPANTNQPGINANATSNSSQSSPVEAPIQRNTGTIEVSSVPPGAGVLLISTDGDTAGEPQSKGSTPTTISGVKPGKYTIDLEKAGYRFFQKEIVVKSGATIKVSASLKKQ